MTHVSEQDATDALDAAQRILDAANRAFPDGLADTAEAPPEDGGP